MKLFDSLIYEVGIVGTFDVENYGDLLFPIIAQRQLSRRIESVKIVPFSPNALSRNQLWPIDVLSTDVIKYQLPFLSGLLIGGGQIVRFDKGYPIPVSSNINLPIDYWLMPAVLGAILGKPVIWNALGAWTGSAVPPNYVDVLRETLSASALVAVRDEASFTHLDQVGSMARIEQIPDTAFSLAALWPNSELSDEFIAWREKIALRTPYIILQADKHFEPHLQEITALLISLEIKTVVLLPVCRCHGDDGQNFNLMATFNVIESDWLDPILTCEVIKHSSLVIASSLHACITAICYGIVCVRIDSFNQADRKFEIVNNFNNVCRLNETERIVDLYRKGRWLDPLATTYANLLEQYWDRVAEIITGWKSSESANSTSIMLPVIMRLLKNMDVSEVAQEAPRKHHSIWNMLRHGL